MDAAELRRGIGYVIQHAGLFPHRTVARQRRHRAPAARLGQGARPASARMELLERVGLDPAFAKRYPAQLSGGQQQRVGVARALAADPPVMLMDEPFSAVDPVVREQLQDEFLRLQGELGKTILFVTHDIDEAIKLGDQVAVLRVGGTLAQLAAPAYLLAHPVDDFVADFVGRDRGYRALRLPADARALPLRDGADGRARRDRRRRPRAATAGCSSSTTTGSRWAGSSRAPVDGPVAASCCTAAAPSPARTGRCAPPSTRRCPRRAGAGSSSTTAGALVGTVRAHEVLTAIEADRPARARRADPDAAQPPVEPARR